MARLRFEDIATDAAFRKALPVLRQLRGAVPDVELARRWRAAVAQGYRLTGAWRDGVLVGLIGFRVVEDLCHGRSLYVDDLVVDAAARSGGLGAAILAEAARIGAAMGCAQLRLSSGFARTEAHRFYAREGFEKASFQFKRAIAAGAPEGDTP